MTRPLANSIAIAALLLLSGCGDSTPQPPLDLPPTTFGTAQVAGTVRFIGAPPERRMIDLGSRCFEGARVIQEETIVVGAGGGLRDVVVYLKDAPASDGSAQPTRTLDQVNCQYLPHVLAVQVGQPLDIRSSDADRTYHNVHWLSDVNGHVNLDYKPGTVSHVVRLNRPDFIRMRCDVHPWMEAWVGVLPHPFHAVTDAAGRFAIDRVPAGTYTLAMWHPLLGERTQSITVAADGRLDLTLEYAPPTP